MVVRSLGQAWIACDEKDCSAVTKAVDKMSDLSKRANEAKFRPYFGKAGRRDYCETHALQFVDR